MPLPVSEMSLLHNPLDLVEDVVMTHAWSFHRTNEDEMLVDITGRWSDYRLFFAWQEHFASLQLFCHLDLKIPPHMHDMIRGLMARINSRLWLGHFALAKEDNCPVFRYTSALRGVSAAGPELVEDLMEIAVSECERYFPAFQLVIWGGRSPDDALALTMLDPVGEA